MFFKAANINMFTILYQLKKGATCTLPIDVTFGAFKLFTGYFCLFQLKNIAEALFLEKKMCLVKTR